MSTIRLERTGQPPLVFQGQEVARADSRERMDRDHPRWYEIVLYQQETGGYIVHVMLHATSKGHYPHHRAYTAASPQEVARVLRSHNTQGWLKGAPLRGLPTERADQFRQAMHRTYLDTVRLLYQKLGPEWAETPETNREPPGWHLRWGDQLLTRHGTWSHLESTLGDRRDLVAFRTHEEALAACQITALFDDQWNLGTCEPYRYE